MVSPLVADVDVVTHAAAFAGAGIGTMAAALAGAGIETNSPEIKAMTSADIAFGRALIFFWRSRKRITDTSLLRANTRETPR